MSSEAQRVLVVEDASCGISLDAIKCCLQRFRLHPGDKVMLLAVLRDVCHPLGYLIRRDSSAWMGSSQKFVKEVLEQRKEQYTRADEVMEVSKQCDSMKIELDIVVRGEASPKEVVLKAAITFNPSWVILDGKMKKDADYLIARLSCGVSIVKQNKKLERLRRPKAQNFQKQHTHNSSELIGADEVKQPKTASPQKQHIQDSSDLTGGDEQKPKAESPQKQQIQDSSDLIGGDEQEPKAESPKNQQIQIDLAGGEEQEPKAENPQKQQIQDSSDTDMTGGDVQEPDIGDHTCSVCNNRPLMIGWKREFTYEEIHAATDGFSTDNYQLENGFGVVFRGELNGQKITVKQLKNASFQGDNKEFQSVAHMLSEVRHKSLVTLLGYCSDGNHRLLVYEYICNGSLDQYLSSKNHRDHGVLLTWDQRIKVAMGVAKGLKYLHDNDILHRNLRSYNILLTHDYKPLLGDFGLEMTLCEDSDLSYETKIATAPYLAPELADFGEVSQKTDRYSFGVILLQLITGLRSTDPSFGKHSIVGWARILIREKNYPELIGHSLIDSYDVKQLAWVTRVAVKCLKRDPNRRISMDQVIHALSYVAEGKAIPVIRDQPRPGPSGDINDSSTESLHNSQNSTQRPSSSGGIDDQTPGLIPSVTAKEYYMTKIAM